MNLTDVIKKEYETVQESKKEKYNLSKENEETADKLICLFQQSNPVGDILNSFKRGIKGLDFSYGREDIIQLCISAKEIENKHPLGSFEIYFGLFLSALINVNEDKKRENERREKKREEKSCTETKDEEEYLIITEQYTKTLRELLTQNTANVHILGNCGGRVCSHMQKGRVTITGEVGFIGHQDGGTIIVEGNCRDQAGYANTFGTLVIKGDALNEVGGYMYGGEMHIFGKGGNKVGDHMHGGKIYFHKEHGPIAETIKGGEIYEGDKRIY